MSLISSIGSKEFSFLEEKPFLGMCPRLGLSVAIPGEEKAAEEIV